MNLDTENTPAALHLPNTWPRFCALMFDGLLIFLLYIPFYFANQIRIDRTEVFMSWTFVAAITTVVFLFQFIFLKKYSRTPGKMLFGLYVVDIQTQLPKLDNRQVIRRILAGLLSLPLAMAPQALALFRLDRRSVLDLFAGTQVLRDRPRKSPAKIRWILGGIIVLYSAWSGLRGVFDMKNYNFTREGMSSYVR